MIQRNDITLLLNEGADENKLIELRDLLQEALGLPTKQVREYAQKKVIEIKIGDYEVSGGILRDGEVYVVLKDSSESEKRRFNRYVSLYVSPLPPELPERRDKQFGRVKRNAIYLRYNPSMN
jgi:hypothetical protein